MAAKKPVAKKATTSRISPSKRGEGSKAKPKPKTSIVSPSARGEGKTNRKAMEGAASSKVQEAGLGAVVRGAAAVARAVTGRSGSSLQKMQKKTSKGYRKETLDKIKAGEKATKAAQKTSARSQATANRAKAAEKRRITEDKKYQAQKEKRFQKGKETSSERTARLKEESARRDRISRAEELKIQRDRQRDFNRYLDVRREARGK